MIKCFASWKRNIPDSVGGESITLTLVYSSFNKEDIDVLEKNLPKGIIVTEFKVANQDTEKKQEYDKHRTLIMDSFEGRIMGGSIHQGGYIHVPQEEAEQILDLLKEQDKTIEELEERVAIMEEGTGRYDERSR